MNGEHWNSRDYWSRVFGALPHLRANKRGATLLEALLDGDEPMEENLRELWVVAEAFSEIPHQGSTHVPPGTPDDFRKAIREAVEAAGVLTAAEIKNLKEKDAPKCGEPGFVSVLSEFD